MNVDKYLQMNFVRGMEIVSVRVELSACCLAYKIIRSRWRVSEALASSIIDVCPIKKLIESICYSLKQTTEKQLQGNFFSIRRDPNVRP